MINFRSLRHYMRAWIRILDAPSCYEHVAALELFPSAHAHCTNGHRHLGRIDYRMAGNFCGVPIFVIFVVDLVS